MIFYLHYILLTSGLSGTSVLLGVFFKQYSDASQGEIGVLLMSFPFVSIVVKPLFCSLADRYQAHRIYMIIGLIVMMIGFAPFSIIPFFPQFYTNFPRASWYILVAACHTGLGGLGVVWSLGDSLAVNMSQKTGTPFSRMRLMGTVSWGFYGYIIGQINEMEGFPKYVPAFMILNTTVLMEIILLSVWKKEDFIMFDATEEPKLELPSSEKRQKSLQNDHHHHHHLHRRNEQPEFDSTPSSLGGTLRLSSKTATTIRDIIRAEDLCKELKNIEAKQEDLDSSIKKVDLCDKTNIPERKDCEENIKETKKNPQMIIFRMILMEDGRFIKYLLLFSLFGLLLSPMNFVFLSLEEVCREKGCNFSNLAGSVLISQATIETLGFLVVPWVLARISRSNALAFGLIILATRYFFYAAYFYTSNISPYWSLVGEWGHGISYAIFATILADVALMFSNQSSLFIPELRRMGFLSDVRLDNMEKVRNEENAIKMALRATMQAVFGGLMDGLGNGVGSLACGIVSTYSYITLWQSFTILSVCTLIAHQLAELTKSRWSDTCRPLKGTKAFEIMSMDKNRDSGEGVVVVTEKPEKLKCEIDESTNKQQLSVGIDC